MDSDFFDNKTRLVKDDLLMQIGEGDRMAVAASIFSIYAYREMREQLEELDEFRFIFTSNAFTVDCEKDPRARRFGQRRECEQGLFGTEFEAKIKNELSQKAVAAECLDWVKKKAQFRSFKNSRMMGNTFLAVESESDIAAYQPAQGFTTGFLGAGRSSARYSLVMRTDTPASSELLSLFNRAWDSGDVEDVTQAVIDRISAMCKENAPEYVYFLALHRIFSEFLDDISDDLLPNESTGFRQSAIWNKLYDFQREAVISVINKLETFGGCILADSVGLGKTFSALAVIKYYELRNKDILVLCPKKLGGNWDTYVGNYVNNPIAEDKLSYTVLYHTDLGRTKGVSGTGVDLSRFNWGNFDLVVIDESHNFRNGADSARGYKDGKENRYQTLVRKVLQEGKKTKVLMLSATPVNNRFRDLRNQLALAYGQDADAWKGSLRITAGIEEVFANAQKVYARWSKLSPEERTTDMLTNMLDFDFFEVLDKVTVARSRKHIQRYYDMDALGSFPEREKPLNRRPVLSERKGSISYKEIYAELEQLTLDLYMPSRYIQPSRMGKYRNEETGNLTMAGRETGIQKLMSTNLLKRLESSVWSFRATLERILGSMEEALDTIDRFKRARTGDIVLADALSAGDLDADDEEAMAFEVGRTLKIDLDDMDWITWEREISKDAETVRRLLNGVRDINPDNDAKLQMLKEVIAGKLEDPLNPGNSKVIVFTAFADTAKYLYDHISAYARDEWGLECALVVGGNDCKCTVKQVGSDMSRILSCFSPLSKERDAVFPGLAGCDIDILIATDCVSEGQNLQDCDYLINYDIHWNPVRIVQRFGRIDRIGSKNKAIQLVNFWPDVDLDEYIRLRERVESRMHIMVATSTGDDDYINENETGDLEYRRRQLEQMKNEVIDLEDVRGGVSITDLGLNEFRMDLMSYLKEDPSIEDAPNGIHAVVKGEKPGVIFVLKNIKQDESARGKNYLHPYYVVYMSDDGQVVYSHLQPKAVLDAFRSLCRGKGEPDQALCKEFNRKTKNGRNMKKVVTLLEEAVAQVSDAKKESDLDSFFGSGPTTFLTNNIEGMDDFEVICYLAVR